MTPAQAALRQASSQEGLIRLHPGEGWDVEPRPGETPQEAAYRGAVDAATAILEAYDGGTARHSDDVLTVAEAIADRLNVIGTDKKHLRAVAQLHDIGKIMVSSEILNKPGPLNDIEWAQMRRHTIEGEQILATVPEITEVAHLVRACHERYDGAGYPDRLAGEDIPLIARIVFCADAFHAMRCDRPYRGGRPVEEALAEVRANSGTQFDPVVVAALCDVHHSLASRRRHGLGVLRSNARSRRLVALLATLTVSGSAMAATGAYKDLPLIRGGESGNAPAVTYDPMSALKSPVFGVENPSAGAGPAGAGGAAASAKALSSSGADTTRGARAGGIPEPRGVAHGVRGTAPGQDVRPATKVKPPKAEPPTPTAKPPTAKPPRVMPPQAGPKVKKVKVRNPNAATPPVPVKVPKPNAPNANVPDAKPPKP